MSLKIRYIDLGKCFIFIFKKAKIRTDKSKMLKKFKLKVSKLNSLLVGT